MATRGKRKSGGGNPLGWFVAGLVIGLGVAAFLFTKGFIPQGAEPVAEPARPATARGEPELLDETPATKDSRYDFFTVLPEMEVVVPERELSDQAAPDQPANAATEAAAGEAFILQAGSFRNAADADQMKARLTLLGTVANVQPVTVNGETWHRVRLGPVQGVREADQLRRRLQDNGIDVLVLKVSG